MTDDICKVCGEFVTIPDGLEPTEYCNPCAQEEVLKLSAKLARYSQRITDYRLEIERLKVLATCRCGDGFTESDPGTCGNCRAGDRAQAEEIAALKAKCDRLEVVFWDDLRNFEKAPCDLCGYNGANYFQPSVHACAGIYHDKISGVR